MKHIKMLGLAAVAAMALMAFVGAGTASATTLTGVGGAVLGTGTKIEASLDPGTGSAKLVTAFKTIECEESAVGGKTTNETGTAVEGKVETLTFGKCNCEVKVISGGTLSISLITGTSNGTLTSSGAEVTTQCNNTLFGNVHCIYATSKTDLGTLTGSNTTGATATMDIEKSSIPRLATDSLCSEKAEWNAKYVVTNPDTLNVKS